MDFIRADSSSSSSHSFLLGVNDGAADFKYTVYVYIYAQKIKYFCKG